MLKRFFNGKKTNTKEKQTLEDFAAQVLFDPLKMKDLFLAIVLDAKEYHATDVKLVPDKTYMIKYKVDGTYFVRLELPESLIVPLGNTIRVFGKVRLDTKAHQSATCLVDDETLRVTIAPSIRGDIVSIRLASKDVIELSDLWNCLNADKIKEQLRKPNGLILFTGPTSSGKTTLMHGCLSFLNETTSKSIISIEDVVEREFKGVSQFKVSDREMFGLYLKSALRQDADVIMVGECLDKETAASAYGAVTTGHLVLTSAHSFDVFSAIERMENLGITTKEIVESTNLIVNQRLVKKLCPHCRIPKQQKHKLPFGKEYTYEGYEANNQGCEHCRNGYSGIIPILGTLEMSEEIRAILLSDSSHDEKVKEIQKRKEYISLNLDVLFALGVGLTSIEAVNEVINESI